MRFHNQFIITHLSKPTSDIIPSDSNDVISSMMMLASLVSGIFILGRVKGLVSEGKTSTVRERLVELAVVVG